MSDPIREVYERLLDRHRQLRAIAPKSPEWTQVESELKAHGIDTTDFGPFSSVMPVSFDNEAAAPILVEWLPRVRIESGSSRQQAPVSRRSPVSR